MLVHPWDAPVDAHEWNAFVRSQGFGHLIASGRDRDVPIVVPTQFVLADDAESVLLHLARPNPIWKALEENPHVLLSVAGDWAYIPTHLKVLPGEDGSMGIPTTYYAAAQLVGTAAVLDDEASKIDILRRTLELTEPDSGHADPSEHVRLLSGIRGIRIEVSEVKAKFKYGGNVTDAHRAVVAEGLMRRSGPGDSAALTHLERRTPLL
jgi:transcriptional regulator